MQWRILVNRFIQAEFHMCDRYYLINHENRLLLYQQLCVRPWEPKNPPVKRKGIATGLQKITTCRNNIIQSFIIE